MHLSPEYFIFTTIFILGLISPGPDFALITRNSLLYSRSAGRWSALGVALGILVHVSYCLIGIGFIIERSILLFTVLKLAGAAYLIYLGSKALLSKKSGASLQPSDDKKRSDITSRQALNMGFVTNALNPKATVLFVSLFTQVIGPNTTMVVKALYGAEMFTLTLCWYLILASAFALVAKTRAIGSFLRYIEKVTGVVLIGFGLRLAFARSD